MQRSQALLNFKLSFFFCIFEDGFLETRNVGKIVKGLWRWRNLISWTGEAAPRSSIPFRRWQCQRGVVLHSISVKLEKREWRGNDDVGFVERRRVENQLRRQCLRFAFLRGPLFIRAVQVIELNEGLEWYFVS